MIEDEAEETPWASTLHPGDADVLLEEVLPLSPSPPCLSLPSARTAVPCAVDYDVQGLLASISSASQARTCVSFTALVNGQRVKILLDSGATDSYAKESYVQQPSSNVLVRDGPVAYRVRGALGEVSEGRRVASLRLGLGTFAARFTARVAPLAVSYDLILGMDFISRHAKSTDWDRGEWALRDADGRVHLFQPSTAASPPSDLFALDHDDPTPGEIEELTGRQFRRAHGKQATSTFIVAVMGDGSATVDGEALALEDEADRVPPGSSSAEEVVRPANLATSRVLRGQLEGTIDKYLDRFRKGIPCAPGVLPEVQALLDTGTARPVEQRGGRLSPAMADELREQVSSLLKKGFIQPSSSSWSSPVLFVRKADGSWRFCVDYRALNQVTQRDRYPLPVISECLDRLTSAAVFSKIDLTSGYHQLRIAAADVPKTAFSCRYGLFEWVVLPFGLKNAPSVFQRLMNNVLAEFIDKFVIVYLDDILIFSDSEDEHAEHVEAVLAALKTADLWLNGKKCEFGADAVDFVGHRVSSEGIAVQQEKVNAIRDWPRPRTVTEVRSFVGLASFYRKFIHRFAHMAAPLHDLTAGSPRKNDRVEWSPRCEAAFLQLKSALQSAPVLVPVDAARPFLVRTDCSDFAAGAELLQQGRDGLWHPVAFESKKLSNAEVNYPAQERELLAILLTWRAWGFYLDGAVETTVVETDHASLAYLSAQKTPPKRLLRWIEEFSVMDCKIVYKKGSAMVVADALSRRCDLAALVDAPSISSDWPALVPDVLAGRLKPKDVESLMWEKANKNKADFAWDQAREVLFFTRDKEQAPFVPFLERADLMDTIHRQYGHRGVHQTLSLLASRGWWPGRRADVESYCRSCPECQVFSRALPNQEPEPRFLLPAVRPFERWGLDLMTMPKSKEGFVWIIAAVDYVTGWPVARPLVDAKKETIAKFVWEEIVMRHGSPDEILTDRGANLLSGYVSQYLELLKTKHLKSSGYHARSNGKIERFNGTFHGALRKFNTTGQKERWAEFFDHALFAARVNEDSTTRYSAFELTYGVPPRLPVDVPRLRAPIRGPPDLEEQRHRLNRTADIREEAQSRRQERAVREKDISDRENGHLAPEDEAAGKGRVARRTRRGRKYHEGDIVMRSNEAGKKEDVNWHGPYTIVKSLPLGVYLLADHLGVPFPHPDHGKRLKFAHLPAGHDEAVPFASSAGELRRINQAAAREAKAHEAEVKAARESASKLRDELAKGVGTRVTFKLGDKILGRRTLNLNR